MMWTMQVPLEFIPLLIFRCTLTVRHTSDCHKNNNQKLQEPLKFFKMTFNIETRQWQCGYYSKKCIDSPWLSFTGEHYTEIWNFIWLVWIWDVAETFPILIWKCKPKNYVYRRSLLVFVPGTSALFVLGTLTVSVIIGYRIKKEEYNVNTCN